MTTLSNIFLGSEESSHFAISSIEQFPDGHGWHGTLNLRSGPFALIAYQFYFDDLDVFLKQIKSLYSSLSGTATLRLRYEYDFIEVTGLSRGHIAVKGHFGTSAPETNRLDIEFVLDQTYLPPLISSIENVIKETNKS